MYLVSFGTRPELIKVIPLILKFKEENVKYLTLFTGQHKDLINDYIHFIGEVDYYFEDVMEKGQSLNKLVSKILVKVDDVITKIGDKELKIIVQGDTSSALAIGLAAFNRKCKLIHLEAGLRTEDKYSPYPEEVNRRIISVLGDIHLCPTKKGVENLLKENNKTNVYNTGNTIVDMYKYVSENFEPSILVKEYIDKEYFLVSLHRRENRGEKMKKMWGELKELSKSKNLLYLTHPSLSEVYEYFKGEEAVSLLKPVCYEDMVFLIKNCKGIISDSGGIQEEAVCAGKKILICRDTTERPETVECGFGKLIDTEILKNINFLEEEDEKKDIVNPYGNNVVKKIYNII